MFFCSLSLRPPSPLSPPLLLLLCKVVKVLVIDIIGLGWIGSGGVGSCFCRPPPAPYLSRMQLTLYATRPPPHGASRLVQAMCAWSVKTRHAPSRHFRGAGVYMVIRLRPCMRSSTPSLSSTPPPLPPPSPLLPSHLPASIVVAGGGVVAVAVVAAAAVCLKKYNEARCAPQRSVASVGVEARVLFFCFRCISCLFLTFFC